MYHSRRSFIRGSAMAVAAATLSRSKLLAFAPKKELVGLQLYSVRAAMKADPKATLKKLSEGGYRYIEHAGYADRKFYGIPVMEFKRLMEDLRLSMPSGHSVMTAAHWDVGKKDFTDEWKYTIADAAEAGQQFVISPWLDENLRTDLEGLKRFMDQFNKCGELCKKHGIKFGYHNHNFEFTTKVEQGNLFDFILHNTDPALVAQQLDIGNMFGAGASAKDYINKYPGRFELLHVKDEIKSDAKGDLGDGYDSTILGKGLLPVKEILALARQKGGTTHYIVEQESYQGNDPVDCVKIDLQIINKWGYR